MNRVDNQQIIDITLAPGDYFFGSGYKRIHTLLGSCIAVTLWHPQKHIGGMCHYLLPTRVGNQKASAGHYADETLDIFIRKIRISHTFPEEYEVKLFGGGNMFGIKEYKGSAETVSQKNIEIGKKLLHMHGFSSIKSNDLGGFYHRKIYLELWNGDVWVKRGHKVKNG